MLPLWNARRRESSAIRILLESRLSACMHAPEVRGQMRATIFILETARVKPDSLLLLGGCTSYLPVCLEKKKKKNQPPTLIIRPRH